VAGCCDEKSESLNTLSTKRRRVLWTVLVINAVMFVAELTAGFLTRSLSLTGDSLDMLGDALAYGTSLYVVDRSLVAKARAAWFKGVIMLSFAGLVLIRALYQLFEQTVPHASGMGLMGMVVLAANLVCLALLTRYRDDDINMRSIWLCSRNDIIANVAVLAAAGFVALTNSLWPDVIVGLGITVLFYRSAMSVMREARASL
jgi:Co/Zn/Cd efflux system component